MDSLNISPSWKPEYFLTNRAKNYNTDLFVTAMCDVCNSEQLYGIYQIAFVTQKPTLELTLSKSSNKRKLFRCVFCSKVLVLCALGTVCLVVCLFHALYVWLYVCCRDFRSLVIDMVLATDMSYHFQQIKNMKNLISLPET